MSRYQIVIKISTLIKKEKLSGQAFRYLIMASIAVTVEVGIFWLMNSFIHMNYLLATAVSMLAGIVLNWLGSKYFVFSKSRFTAFREFLLVFIVSLVGLAIQIMTIYFLVTKAHAVPLVGKIAAIGVTFVWNFFIRRVYIFKPRE